jgi:hypothetical protein
MSMRSSPSAEPPVRPEISAEREEGGDFEAAEGAFGTAKKAGRSLWRKTKVASNIVQGADDAGIGALQAANYVSRKVGGTMFRHVAGGVLRFVPGPIDGASYYYLTVSTDYSIWDPEGDPMNDRGKVSNTMLEIKIDAFGTVTVKTLDGFERTSLYLLEKGDITFSVPVGGLQVLTYGDVGERLVLMFEIDGIVRFSATVYPEDMGIEAGRTWPDLTWSSSVYSDEREAAQPIEMMQAWVSKMT